MKKFRKRFIWYSSALLGLALIIAITGSIVSNELTFFDIIYKTLLIEIGIMVYFSILFFIIGVMLILCDYIKDEWNKWYNRLIVLFFALLIPAIYFFLMAFIGKLIYPEMFIDSDPLWYIPVFIFILEITFILIYSIGLFIWKKTE